MQGTGHIDTSWVIPHHLFADYSTSLLFPFWTDHSFIILGGFIFHKWNLTTPCLADLTSLLVRLYCKNLFTIREVLSFNNWVLKMVEN